MRGILYQFRSRAAMNSLSGIVSALLLRMTSSDIEIASIDSKIYFIRAEKVMLDADLALLYEIPTKRLKEQVRRNLKRFPSDFMFSLSEQEFTILRSQFATSRLAWGGARVPPFAFTEQGIAMLSTVLNSERAISVNIAIMRTFVGIRQILNSDRELEKKILALESKYDGQFRIVFDALKKLIAAPALPHKPILGLRKKS
jgi:hypothetical protein